MAGILVFFHCESRPRYAAATHEQTFFRMAQELVERDEQIYFAYRDLGPGLSPTLPVPPERVLHFDPAAGSTDHLSTVADYLRRHRVTTAFGFDQPVRSNAHRYLREAGVENLISYWGAPMGSPNSGLRLMLKRMDVALAPHRPDHFIFQSEGMRDAAIRGRGVARANTSVVRTGIDTGRFRPAQGDGRYVHDLLGIPEDRHVIVFCGHVDFRKGVDVTVRAAVHLAEVMQRDDYHLLILGNLSGQENQFESILGNSRARDHVTFAGYRDDVDRILPSCDIGFIASTDWDSFPMASIEMAACGLPLLLSDIPGLREAVTPETGLLYPAGDHVRAAEQLAALLDDESGRREMGRIARERAVAEFSVDSQIRGLTAVIRDVQNARNAGLRA